MCCDTQVCQHKSVTWHTFNGGNENTRVRGGIAKEFIPNNMNKFVVRHVKDQALSGLKPNSDKTVINPSLKAGVSGYTSYRGFSPDITAT